MKYYSLSKIDKTNGTYRVIFGERSNGKTFACLEKWLLTYATTGKQGAYIRRWDEDIRPKRMEQLFASIITDSKVWKKYYADTYDGIAYRSGKFFLYGRDDKLEKRILEDDPIGFAFSLSSMEHDKSTSFPNVDLIIFDEFLTRRMYLPDEFVLFMNCLSTIIRQRTSVVVYMLGNTVNKTCPYFTEMGLMKVKDMKEGTIDVYSYGNSELTVAVEYASTGVVKHTSNKYFAFDNPKLQMITGGKWEMSIYPHLPHKYRPKDVLLSFFVEWETEMLQCELVCTEYDMFIFVHRKTTPIKDESNDIVYSPNIDSRPNWRRRITVGNGKKIDKIIKDMFLTEKVFYSDNEVGEIMRNYLLWCGGSKINS